MRINVDSSVVKADVEVNSENITKGLNWLKKKAIKGLKVVEDKLTESEVPDEQTKQSD